jgi:hypothetical protein
MPDFDWIESDGLDDKTRYASVEMLGEEAWKDIWRTLQRIAERTGADDQAPWDDAFQTFLNTLGAVKFAGSAHRLPVSCLRLAPAG